MTSLFEDGRLINDKIDIANTMNKYFVYSVTNTVLNAFGPTIPPITRYPIPVADCFYIRPCNEEVILKELKRLGGFSTGHNSIPYKFLSLDLDYFVAEITRHVNSSIATSRFPDCWKVALVDPKHKSESSTSKANYRPLSKLPNLSKVIERVVATQTSMYLADNALLFGNQFGFRKNLSTKAAFTYFIDTIAISLDMSQIVLAVFIDLSKAFDVINHDNLLLKLSTQFNFSDPAVAWFRSYLSNRSQAVRINDGNSDFLPLTMGVPQGSILGPMLFNLYVNDMCLVPKNCQLILYADDGILYCAGKDLNSIIVNVNEDLHRLQNYCTENRLLINPAKSKE